MPSVVYCRCEAAKVEQQSEAQAHQRTEAELRQRKQQLQAALQGRALEDSEQGEAELEVKALQARCARLQARLTAQLTSNQEVCMLFPCRYFAQEPSTKLESNTRQRYWVSLCKVVILAGVLGQAACLPDSPALHHRGATHPSCIVAKGDTTQPEAQQAQGLLTA